MNIYELINKAESLFDAIDEANEDFWVLYKAGRLNGAHAISERISSLEMDVNRLKAAYEADVGLELTNQRTLPKMTAEQEAIIDRLIEKH